MVVIQEQKKTYFVSSGLHLPHGVWEVEPTGTYGCDSGTKKHVLWGLCYTYPHGVRGVEPTGSYSCDSGTKNMFCEVCVTLTPWCGGSGTYKYLWLWFRNNKTYFARSRLHLPHGVGEVEPTSTYGCDSGTIKHILWGLGYTYPIVLGKWNLQLLSAI